jgi:hypothetical protein
MRALTPQQVAGRMMWLLVAALLGVAIAGPPRVPSVPPSPFSATVAAQSGAVAMRGMQ